MKIRATTGAAGALIVGLSLAGLSGAAAAKTAGPDTMKATPRFVVLPAKHADQIKPNVGLTTWNFSYTYKSNNYTDTFVGTNPKTGASTTTPVFIIPIAITIGAETFSTSTVQANGSTALLDTTNSPIFKSSVKFVEGSKNLGKTQYEDAYQRESFWKEIHKANPDYHILLGQPTVLPEVTLTPPKSDGKVGTEFGVHVALVDINWLDGQVNAIIAANPQITTSAVPIFVLYDTYETEGGCCIGGYHSTTGAQTYAIFDYLGTPGVFSQDVSALSHEMGEWLDDPFTNNNSPCGIYENGDPLEREANYGGYPYTANGMTYNLQDLAQPPYFGAPPKTSLDSRFTFQGTALTVCENGS